MRVVCANTIKQKITKITEGGNGPPAAARVQCLEPSGRDFWRRWAFFKNGRSAGSTVDSIVTKRRPCFVRGSGDAILNPINANGMADTTQCGAGRVTKSVRQVPVQYSCQVQCRRWESNPDGRSHPEDFKSSTSAASVALG